MDGCTVVVRRLVDDARRHEPTTEAKPHEAAEPTIGGAKAKPEPKRPQALRFHRNDVVRLRKRSHVAQGLGVDDQRTFVVELMTRHEGRPVVVLRFGSGKHAAYMKVPPAIWPTA
jgi:hypothetical protein